MKIANVCLGWIHKCVTYECIQKIGVGKTRASVQICISIVLIHLIYFGQGFKIVVFFSFLAIVIAKVAIAFNTMLKRK